MLERQIDIETTCDAHANLGGLHYKRGRLALAHDHYMADLTLARKHGDKQRTASALANVASIEHAREQFDNAQVHLEEALSLNRELCNTGGVARNLGELGRVYFQLGKYDLAKSAADEALTMFTKENDLDGMMAAHLHLGNVASVTGDARLGRSHLLNSLRLARKQESSFLAASCYANLGNSELEMKHPRRAHVLFEASLGLASRFGYPELGGAALYNLGRLAFGFGDETAAMSYLESAKRAYQEAERPAKVAIVESEITAIKRHSDRKEKEKM
ncbi:MAG: tetratricopeptide repeat protein [Planctomycetes bacterium]|nr:tetratricopeptide repeat protein [Planctomycetota bacterium]